MHSDLHVSPDIYRKNFPNFGRPKIVGFMSLDSERNYHADTRQLMFARDIEDKSVNFDLNLHMDKVKHQPPNLNERITHLLQFLSDQEKRLNYSNNNIDSAKFFCYRGLLTCVACTPYENREPWRIVATLFKGNIYLCARDTQDKIDRLRNMTERDKMFTSWGYKFEQFVLSDDPDSQPNPNCGVDENEEFSLVFETNLNRHTIVYGAEMDGIRCDRGPVTAPPSTELGPDAIIEYLSNKHFIELKTNRHIEFPNQDNNFRRFKTKKWWCQSFLAGVDTIVAGFRNDEGIVEQLKLYPVKDIAKMSQRFWQPNVCMNFLETFLTYVKRCLAKEVSNKFGKKALNNLQNLPLISLHFEWSPRTPVRVTDAYCYEDDPILPQWFVDRYQKTYADS